ncbi:NUDIX domain-containing protein [Bacillus hwajinpoensis]|uniref:NUDIX domain-containing protein n=1 Tax=Guptibacillus hwajinpoensis TaxID=208199 RepID=A0A845ES18_9BACL|nr:NUDIX hydrolase [Pseudalkalibacillus hwajinpoensis]MYL61800.1 NUDIX domain-containing protein [Pseudalkalibacillus hwajinpoensis]
MNYVKELRELVGQRPLILVGAVALILNDKDEVLLQQRNERRKRWGLPGGLMEPGESTEETAIRESFEETGLTIRNLALFKLYSGEEFFTKADNGDEFYSVTTAYVTNEYEGELTLTPESLAFDTFSSTNLPAQMVGSHRRMIMDYFNEKNELP